MNRNRKIIYTKEMIERISDKYQFGGNTKAVLERDGYKCVVCGMTNEEHKAKWGVRITIDHIDNKGRYVPPKQKNNALDNLQTLCRRCHGSKDGRIRKRRKIIQ